VPLPGYPAGVVLRATGPGQLALDLPHPEGDVLLTVPLERRPFHRSPGTWFFRCRGCSALRGVLVDVEREGAADTDPAVRSLGWVCRRCAGLPASRARNLSNSQRLANALARGLDVNRRDGEKRRDWRRRRERGKAVRQQAEASARRTLGRLTDGTEL
jgi:hypothetical protein